MNGVYSFFFNIVYDSKSFILTVVDIELMWMVVSYTTLLRIQNVIFGFNITSIAVNKIEFYLTHIIRKND